MNRLHPSSLHRLPAGVARPVYDRQALRCGIVHLGVGAFQRAHLAAATEAAVQASGDLRWGIAGVSLRHADTRDALAPQRGLYTLALRDAADDGTPRETLQVIGTLMELQVAPEDPHAVLERIAHPDTRIVSLTVTEKGYHYHPATGALRLGDPDIEHDLMNAAQPRSTIGILVRGLQLRRQRAMAPVTLLSCDNLPANGRTLRGLVLAFAEQVGSELQQWIADRCTFPNSMVDRIVPRTTDADRERIAATLGLHDAWPVIGEPFFDWVVEDRFATGRPDWTAAGARFVDNAEPFERLKLRMVNGSHSALAYLGAMAGYRTVDQAMAAPALRRFIDTMMRDEIAPTLSGLNELDLQAYRARLLTRFANPALQHQTRQIAMDGSQKLPQRLLGTVRDRLRAAAPINRLALAIAGWIHYLGGVDESGQPHSIEDPLASALVDQWALAHQAAAGISDPTAAECQRIAAFCNFTPVFGDLGSEPGFARAVAGHTLRLRQRGVLAALHEAG